MQSEIILVLFERERERENRHEERTAAVNPDPVHENLPDERVKETKENVFLNLEGIGSVY